MTTEENIANEKFKELIVGYHFDNEFVSMDQPRLCLRQNTDYHGKLVGDYDTLGEEVCAITSTENTFSSLSNVAPDLFREINVELRGITLRQLRAMDALIDRRCTEEKWTNSPDKVNLHDLNRDVIKPFTENTKRSFVETLPSTAGTQPPIWYLSHNWSEPFKKSLACIETFVKDFAQNLNGPDNHAGVVYDDGPMGGGMTVDTPIWICLFANNQHNPLEDIPSDLTQTGFAKAMKIADYRTLSILDSEGAIFSRIWCIDEIYLTLSKNGLWAIYTALEHTASIGYFKKWGCDKEIVNDYREEERKSVGTIPGGATADQGGAGWIANREKPFPIDLMHMSQNIQIETAKATMEVDRKHILNHICNLEDLDAEPPTSHEEYSTLNDAVKGQFACSLPFLSAALLMKEDEQKKVFISMSKSINREMALNFEHIKWQNDKSDNKFAVIGMINHLPTTIERLRIVNAPYGADFIDAIVSWMEEKANNFKRLEICGTYVGEGGGRDAGEKLAKAIAESTTIEHLELTGTDLVGGRNATEWEKALGQWEKGLRQHDKPGKLVLKGSKRKIKSESSLSDGDMTMTSSQQIQLENATQNVKDVTIEFFGGRHCNIP